jgi:hypothetical protein
MINLCSRGTPRKILRNNQRYNLHHRTVELPARMAAHHSVHLEPLLALADAVP